MLLIIIADQSVWCGVLPFQQQQSSAAKLWCVFVDTKGKSKMTSEEELRASKGKGKMVDPVDADDDEEDEEDFDEEVRFVTTHHPDLNPTCRVCCVFTTHL